MAVPLKSEHKSSHREKKEKFVSIVLFCLDCGKKFQGKYNAEDTGITEQITSIHHCPGCSNNWRENCGIDFEVYPLLEETLLKVVEKSI